MHFLNLAATTLSLLTLTAAQNSTTQTSGTATTASSNYGLNPSTIDIGTRQYWCNQQEAQCPLICGDINNDNTATHSNNCEPESLSYTCVCSNGQSPNATEYTQTIPYFECTSASDQCVNNCNAADTQCQSNCRESRKCGATSPHQERNRTMTTSSSAAATASATGGSGSTGTSALINGSGTGAAVAVGPSVGFATLVGLVTLGLAVLL